MSGEFERAVSNYSHTLGAAIKNLSSTRRGSKQLISVLADLCMVVCSLWLAFSIRFGEPFTDIASNIQLFLLLPPITVFIFGSLGVYKWVVRSSNDSLTNSLIKGGLASAACLLALMFLLPSEGASPRSVFAIYGLLFTAWVVFARHLWSKFSRLSHFLEMGERVAVYGAGRAGQQFVDMMKFDKTRHAVFFIDDDPMLQGSILAGLPVINGDLQTISKRITRKNIDRVILAIPSLCSERYRELTNKLTRLPVPVQTLPNLDDIVSGRASVDQVRDVSVSDLLGRSIVEPDYQLMRKCIENKVILVTGGGGSIGSELCRQIISLHPAKLIVFDHSEENLYRISEEMSDLPGTNSVFVPVLGSVTNKDKLNWLFENYKINTVYLAAAYKHVPIVESYPEEAIAVNIFGTLNVLDLAFRYEIDHLTLISTDKAVRPANYMGATKRVAEMILQAKSRMDVKTTVCAVRFGNVLGSSGSVVPKFKQQIANGGPVTITDRKITRYFMTVPEASQLVLQASALAKGGEIFVLDMGEPVRIYELAKLMVRLSGKSIRTPDDPFGDIEIKEIGLRPGEKMYEELFTDNDSIQTSIKKIHISQEPDIDWSDLHDVLTPGENGDFCDVKLKAYLDKIKIAVNEGDVALEDDNDTFEEDLHSNVVVAAPETLQTR